MRKGITYKHGDIVFSGFEDSETEEILELSASFACPGYWGKSVKTYVYPQDNGYWRIECGANNQRAEYMSNSWETWHSAVGYASADDAIEACLDWVAKQREQNVVA